MSTQPSDFLSSSRRPPSSPTRPHRRLPLQSPSTLSLPPLHPPRPATLPRPPLFQLTTVSLLLLPPPTPTSTDHLPPSRSVRPLVPVPVWSTLTLSANAAVLAVQEGRAGWSALEMARGTCSTEIVGGDEGEGKRQTGAAEGVGANVGEKRSTRGNGSPDCLSLAYSSFPPTCKCSASRPSLSLSGRCGFLLFSSRSSSSPHSVDLRLPFCPLPLFSLPP